MKKLQNNFTTPEQSKRLLELGVPADSADCRFETAVHDGGIKQTYRILGSPIHSNDTPCWSAGRLIEIWEVCVRERFERKIDLSTGQLKPLIQDVIEQIEKHLNEVYRHLDFSKNGEVSMTEIAKCKDCELNRNGWCECYDIDLPLNGECYNW